MLIIRRKRQGRGRKKTEKRRSGTENEFPVNLQNKTFEIQLPKSRMQIWGAFFYTWTTAPRITYAMRDWNIILPTWLFFTKSQEEHWLFVAFMASLVVFQLDSILYVVRVDLVEYNLWLGSRGRAKTQKEKQASALLVPPTDFGAQCWSPWGKKARQWQLCKFKCKVSIIMS